MGVSVTNSNRRVRTRTHGGVAGVGGLTAAPMPIKRASGHLNPGSSATLPYKIRDELPLMILGIMGIMLALCCPG
jgi:hypothetical protein